MVCTIGYIIIIAIVFTAAAGRTMATNSAAKPPGKPTISNADNKNTVPDKMVPIAVRIAHGAVFGSF